MSDCEIETKPARNRGTALVLVAILSIPLWCGPLATRTWPGADPTRESAASALRYAILQMDIDEPVAERAFYEVLSNYPGTAEAFEAVERIKVLTGE